jgi:putative transposase
MRKTKFTEPQVIAILRELEAGATLAELGRRHGVHPNTIVSWRHKFSGATEQGVTRMRQLEEENLRLKRAVANLTLENEAIRELLEKNFPGPRSAKKP